MCPAGSRRVPREGVGLGVGRHTVLYHDRSPLHTNFLVKEERTDLNLLFFPPCRRCLSAKAHIKKQSSRISPYYHLTGSLHTYWRNISHHSESITKADFHLARRMAMLNFSETLFFKISGFFGLSLALTLTAIVWAYGPMFRFTDERRRSKLSFRSSIN